MTAIAAPEPSIILARARDAGFTFAVDGEQVIVSPASKLTELQRETIRAHKPRILELLREEAAWARSTEAMDGLVQSGWQPNWSGPDRQEVLAVQWGDRWEAWEPNAWKQFQEMANEMFQRESSEVRKR